jgi:hypothetical protein
MLEARDTFREAVFERDEYQLFVKHLVLMHIIS